MEQPKEVSPEQMTFLLDYWETFGSEMGQRVLNDLRTKYREPTFTEDSHRMAYLMGQRDVVIEIEEVMSVKGQDIKVEEENHA